MCVGIHNVDPKQNNKPDVSPANGFIWGQQGIASGTCYHGGPCASPLKQRRTSTEGRGELGRAIAVSPVVRQNLCQV